MIQIISNTLRTKLLLCCLFILQSDAFNVDDKIPIIKKGPENSLFGLSVEQHSITREPRSKSDIVLLVGAPTAAAASYQLPGSVRPGALFRCAVSSQEQCDRLRLDDAAVSFTSNNSNGWLGVTVKSQKPGGRVAVCAHRYTIHGGNPNRGIWEAAIGRCFVLNNQLEEQEGVEPCIGKLTGGEYSIEGYGYCQAGTSFAFAQTVLEDFVIGTPGVGNWNGGIYINQFNPTFFTSATHSHDSKKDDEKKNSYNNYIGFSSASYQDGSDLFFIAGAPRGNDSGQVYVFSELISGAGLHQSEVLNGEVLASSFGYEVKAVDVTGDNRPDLIVGAPQYYDRESKHGGAIYLYVNKGTGEFGPLATTVLYGELDSAFGNSITTLGDVNKDGFNDIAIGAPGADGGVGRVYIHHGDQFGIKAKPSQIIKGINLFPNNFKIKGFGYSLSGGLDMDLNGYPDLAVGSLSDAAVIFRSRPIIDVMGYIITSTNKVNIDPSAQFNPNVVLAYDKSSKQFQNVVSFNITACLNYSSSESFDMPIEISFTIQLDTLRIKDDLQSRISFVPFEHKAVQSDTMKLPSHSVLKTKCVTYPLYLNNNIQDKLSPFEMLLSYDILEKNISADGQENQLPSLDSYPVSNKDLLNTASTQVNISKNCGSDEICKSNLQMSAEYVVLMNGKKEWEVLTYKEQGLPVLFVGTEKRIGIRVNITNVVPGEDAHQARLKILFPNFFSYVDFESKSAIVSCSKENTSMEICDIGNPFRSKSTLSLTIRFENDEQLYEVDRFTLRLALSTSSVQDDLAFIPYTALVKVQAQLKIDSYADKPQIRFGGEVIGESAVKKPSDAGAIINYDYEVENKGTSEVGPVVLRIGWPYAIANGKWLLYLLDVSSEVKCNVQNEFLDPLNLFGERSSESTSLRQKREALTDADSAEIEPAAVKSAGSRTILQCPETAHCVNITCNLGVLVPNRKTFINVKGIVWNSTFLEEYEGEADIKVNSFATISLNHSNVLYANSSVLSKEMSISLSSQEIGVVEPGVQWWIIAVATAAGVVLLVMLVLLLWRCGFFKRRRDLSDYHKAHKHRQASKKADQVSDKLVY